MMNRIIPILLLFATALSPIASNAAYRSFYRDDVVAGTLAVGKTTIATTSVALDVNGALLGRSSVTVQGAANLTSTLNVTGAAALASTLGVVGNASVGGIFKSVGAAEMQSTLGVISNTSVGGIFKAVGAAEMQSTLGVIGNASVAGTFTVVGATSLGTLTGKPVLASNVNSQSATDGQVFVADGAGAASFATIGTASASTYSPTLTNGANVAASTTNTWFYSRIGDIVSATGRISVDPTAAAGTSTNVDISIPVASNFTVTTDLAGTCGSEAVTDESSIIYSDSTSDRAELIFSAQDTANHILMCSFKYIVK
jgi:hypothetical protein